MGFILMYDITNEESFNSVQDWYVFLLLLRSKEKTIDRMVMSFICS